MRPARARPAGEGRVLQLVYYAYVWGSALARALPEKPAYAVADLLGSLMARFSKKKEIVARNLSRITGQPPESRRVQRLVKASFRSYARYWLETFRLVRESKEFFLERFRCDGEEQIDKVRARGKGALVVVGHLGNWDAAGAWVAASGRPATTVAEVLKPRRMFDFFVAHRARLGITIHPAQKGATDVLANALEEGRVVALLGDRDLKGTGPEVTFFGERVTFPAGAASIALRTGVPVLIACVYTDPLPDGRPGWRAEFGDPIELPPSRGPDAVRELTQQIAARLEDCVRAHPEEWHVFQPFWPSDRGTQKA